MSFKIFKTKRTYVLLAMALGLMLVNMDFALAATSGGVFGTATSTIGGDDTITTMIINIVNRVVKRVWYGSMGVVIAKNLWDMRSGDIWGNVKDMVVGIAVSTLILNALVPAVVNIGNTAGTEVTTISTGGK